MLATQWDEKLIEQIAKEFEPDVVRVRARYGEDFDGTPSVKFLVTLSDEAAARERVWAVYPRQPEAARTIGSSITRRLEKAFSEKLGLLDAPYSSHFYFRNQSEQAAMQDPLWK